MLDTLLSIVLVTQNTESTVSGVLASIRSQVEKAVSDYEIIIIDNASSDNTLSRLEEETARWPNIQVYCFANAIDIDAARLAGLEQAIGDYVLIFDPENDDFSQLPEILKQAEEGAQLVTVHKQKAASQSGIFYRFFSHAFVTFFFTLSGYHLRKDAPHFRLMSRRLVNYVLQHENAHLTYHLLPVSAGFKISRIFYDALPTTRKRPARSFHQLVDNALALIVTTSNVPLRLITYSCALSGAISLVYSVYVVMVYFFKKTVTPGWTTLSLQFSVQFFLLSLALALLAEYVLQISRQTDKRPKYYIIREFRSNQITHELKLNLKKEE